MNTLKSFKNIIFTIILLHIINLSYSKVNSEIKVTDFGLNYKSTVTKPDTVTNSIARLVSNTEALITFVAPINNGGSDIISYTVTSTPGNITVTNASSPVLLSGLTPNVTYTFTIVATNSIGNSLAVTTPSLTMGGYWDLNGNEGLTNSNFLGTKDSQAVNFKTNNTLRMEIGSNGVIDFKNNTIIGFKASVEDKTSAYILNASDNGKFITFNVNSNLTLTIPPGLPIGFNINILQKGNGVINFQAGSGVTLNNRGGFYTTIGKFAAVSLISYDNNVYILSGDLN